MKEALELALEALEEAKTNDDGIEKWDRNKKAITAIKAALAQEQEPVAWKTMEEKYPSLEKLDIRMGDGSILCDVWPQSDGDFWWAGSGTGEKFIDPKYADVTHWRVHSDTTPPQPAQQEPVAYLCENAVGHKYFRWKKPSSTYKPIPLYTTPPQPEERNFCPRCGKRTADLIVIHTCTPPQENT